MVLIYLYKIVKQGSPFKTQVRGRTPKCTLENVEPFTYPWVFPLDIYNHVISRSVAAVSASGKFGIKIDV